ILTDRGIVNIPPADEMGLAIVNPNDRAVTVTVRFIPNPLVVFPAPPTRQIEIAPRHQIVRFISDIFDREFSTPPLLPVAIRSDAPVSVATVKFRGRHFSRAPVVNRSTQPFTVPERNGVGGPGAIVLPIFAQFDGFYSRLVLIDPSESAVSGRVDIFNSNGDPLPMDLNGQIASTFRYYVLSGFIFELKPTGIAFGTLERGASSFPAS